jgi:acyl-CoA reductase-like NAD-dependent aldehyde dehydrogenase
MTFHLPDGDPDLRERAEPMAPCGGVKNYGYGKLGGTAGIESFTEQRWVTIQHSGRPHYPF